MSTEPIRVLLADDHVLVREGLRNALRTMEQLHIVAEVGDGRDLLTALDEHNPALLLLDLTMPHFDTFNAIRHIRHTYPDVLILVVSAYDNDTYVQGVLNAGVHGYHLKDQPLSDLRLAVERVLEGQRWVSGPLVGKLLNGTRNQRPPEITKRQEDILRHLIEGYDNRGIAHQLGISIKTVENHLTRLYRQLGVNSRLEAVSYTHDHPELLPEMTSPHAAPPISQPAVGQDAILLVDDNHRYRYQMRRMVVKYMPDVKVYEAGTVAQAISIADTVIPQLAIIDVLLNDEDGIICAQHVKRHQPTVPIVLISAYPEFQERALETGALAFIDKRDLDSNAMQNLLLEFLHD